MGSRLAFLVLREAHAVRDETERGAGRRALRTMAGRSAELQIADIGAIAVEPKTTDLQDETGATTFFVLGYSTLGGGDALA